MKYYLWTIGCQYNEWDGARLKYFLDQNGLVESSVKDANIIIILACSVRQTAVDRIFGNIRNWRNNTDFQHRSNTDNPVKPKNKMNNKIVLATGCVLDSDKKKFTEKGIDFFESGDFNALTEIISASHSERAKRHEESIRTRSFSCAQDDRKKTKKPISYLAKSCSYVPIMVGCNNFCSYCAVPYVRGREKSRPANGIVNDVKNLIDNRQKDILLLGQNVNSFQSQISPLRQGYEGQANLKSQTYNSKLKNYKTDFTILLKELNSLEGDFKIGFMSNHPKDMSDDIIEAVAKLPKIKKEIHLPLQSGSDKILKLMNRPYTAKQYLKIISKIKKANSDIKITTDVIVGFPGETEEDFQNTVEIFNKVDFKQAYINKYSPRVGTAAYKLGDPVPWSEKQRRWRILNSIPAQNKKSK